MTDTCHCLICNTTAPAPYLHTLPDGWVQLEGDDFCPVCWGRFETNLATWRASLPLRADTTHRQVDEASGPDIPCDVCGLEAGACICPVCSVCGVAGNPECYDPGHDTAEGGVRLTPSPDQEIGRLKLYIQDLEDQLHDAKLHLEILTEPEACGANKGNSDDQHN